MAICLNEEELRKLLEKLIDERKSVDDGICVLCLDIHDAGDYCQCDNDE